jgi:hypothetical protein
MTNRIGQESETDRLMREARELETGKKEKMSPEDFSVTTFLEYQQKATLHSNYPNMVTPSLGMQAALGRLAVATMRQGSHSPANQEEVAKDLAHLLYYLTALCDQNVITLQKVAEISLMLLEQHNTKKLGK